MSAKQVKPVKYILSEAEKEVAAILLARPEREGIDLLPKVDKFEFVLFYQTLTNSPNL